MILFKVNFAKKSLCGYALDVTSNLFYRDGVTQGITAEELDGK